MATAHVRTDLVEIPEANSKLMVICMDHVTSMVVNIIDEEMGLSLARALLEAEWYIENKLINGLVLCSGKHRNFLAGADILFELKMMNKQRWAGCFYKLKIGAHKSTDLLQSLSSCIWAWFYHLQAGIIGCANLCHCQWSSIGRGIGIDDWVRFSCC